MTGAVAPEPTAPFGQWVGEVLSADNKRQLWIPEGFAHGFVALEDDTHFLYKTTDYYAPEHERSIAWDDDAIGIDWPLAAHGIDAPLLSDKDRAAPTLDEARRAGALPSAHAGQGET
mgnify:CR=1 FL=1